MCLVTLLVVLLTCSISSNIREGLLETFYGVYEKDPDKVIKSKRGRICSLPKFSMLPAVMNLLLISFFLGAGPSGNDSNGRSCANRGHDSCQKDCAVLS